MRYKIRNENNVNKFHIEKVKTTVALFNQRNCVSDLNIHFNKGV